MAMSIRRRGMGRFALRNAERRLAVFGCIELFRLAMECMPPQKRIVLLFLEPIWGARTFLVAFGHVTRRRFTKRLRFGAFENDNLLRHSDYSFTSAGAAVSSSSASPPSSSVRPNRDVTDGRVRAALFCFSS